MKLNSFIRELSTQMIFLFQEKRCVLCHSPFHAKQGSSKIYIENSFQKMCIKKEQNKDSAILQRLIQIATDHVHSNLCMDCAQEIHIKTKGFCPTCGELFTDGLLLGILCGNCAQEKPPWDNFIFSGVYQNSLRELLLKAKFNNSASSLRFLGKFFAHFWLINMHAQSLEMNTQIKYPNIIIPMPLHNKRLKERGYNQCNELTKFFLKECNNIFSIFQINKPNMLIDYTSLVRTHFKQAQSTLNRKERLLNVKNGFIAKNLHNKHVLLIDDIATTNSTVKEASLAIKDAGASQIDVLVLAKSSIFFHK